MLLHFARLARQVCVVGVVALLAACGGGGGGGGNSISVSPRSLSFQASASSPAAPQRVTATFSGDGVIVGYAPGVTPAGWLYVADGGGTATQANFDVSVDPGLPPGTYLTSLRFVTGNADGSDIDYVDVPVSYRVSSFNVSPGAIQLEAIDGSTAEAAPADARSVTISGSGNWSASSDRAWLTLTQATGSGPGSAGFSVNHSGLGIGTHVAHITVNSSGDSGTVTVTLVKRAPRLQVTPAPLEFTLDAGSDEGDLTATLHVTDELAGADGSRAVSWTLDAPTEAWLSVDATSGSSVPGTDVQVSLVPEQLGALANGTHQTALTFRYTNAEVTSAPLTVPVSLTLSVPRAQTVMPSTAVVGRVAPVVLHGYDLGNVQASQVTFDGVAAQSVTALSNTEIRVLPPADLAAGTSDINLTVAGIDLSPASLAVVAPRDRPYATFATSGMPSRVLFDDARETLWVANVTAGALEGYRYDGTQWSSLAPFQVSGLVDIGLHPDGKALVITAIGHVYRLDLDDALATPVMRTNDGYSYYRAAPAADGRLILSSDPPCCSGIFPHVRVDLSTFAVTQFPYPIGDAGAQVNGSLDGTRVHLTGDHYRYRYSSANSTLTQLGSGPYVTAVNRDGTRLANYNVVYDESSGTVGAMTGVGSGPSSRLFTAFGSTSQRIYGYRQFTSNSTAGRNVIIDDMTGTPAGGAFTEVARVPLADDPGWDDVWSSYYYVNAPAPLAVSADERTVFVRGKNKLVIVPVPAP